MKENTFPPNNVSALWGGYTTATPNKKCKKDKLECRRKNNEGNFSMLCSEIGPAALGLYMDLIVVIFLIAGRGKGRRVT